MKSFRKLKDDAQYHYSSSSWSTFVIVDGTLSHQCRTLGFFARPLCCHFGIGALLLLQELLASSHNKAHILVQKTLNSLQNQIKKKHRYIIDHDNNISICNAVSFLNPLMRKWWVFFSICLLFQGFRLVNKKTKQILAYDQHVLLPNTQLTTFMFQCLKQNVMLCF